RVLTAHGSKGLEFDAVHFLDVTANIFEPSREDTNKWLPDGIIAGNTDPVGALRTERHNLLYVVVSRPRYHLTIYAKEGKTLPTALAGLLEPLSDDLATHERKVPQARAVRVPNV